MVKKIFLILFITISNISFAQNISAKASVDSASYLVGDYIHFMVDVNYDKSIKIIPPVIQDSLKNVEVIKADDPVYTEKDGMKNAVFNFILSKYDSADITIPPINIFYRVGKDTLNRSGIDSNDVTFGYPPSGVLRTSLPKGTPSEREKSVQTNPIHFSVRLVKVDLQKDIKDVKDPRKIPLDWKIILLWLLVGLIVLGILFYLYRRYRLKKSGVRQRRTVIKKEIILPPHVVALNSLKALDEKKLWQNGMIKEYHSEITEIIRKYFSERFGLPALELTTSETMQHLRARKEAEIIQDITGSFLDNADLVKFAKFSPMSSVNEEMMKQAIEIVERTIPPRLSGPGAAEKISQEAGNV